MAADPVSARPACALVGLNRSRWHHRPQRSTHGQVRERLRALAGERPRWGYERLHVPLQRKGVRGNHKLVLRLYREEGLALRRRHGRKRVAMPRVPLPRPTARSERWSMDFVSDALADGRVLRCVPLVDDGSREAVAIVAGRSVPGARVIQILDQLAVTRGLPRSVGCDNGPEFAGKALDLWAHQRGVALQFIRPGKPIENAFIESFNGKFRDECLSLHWFHSLTDAQHVIDAWRADYNTFRPHRSLQQHAPLHPSAVSRSLDLTPSTLPT